MHKNILHCYSHVSDDVYWTGGGKKYCINLQTSNRLPLVCLTELGEEVARFCAATQTNSNSDICDRNGVDVLGLID